MLALMTASAREFPDAHLSVDAGVDAPDAVLAPLHSYALGHATGSPDHFLDAFRPTAHVEGIRDGVFASWDLPAYCALFTGPAADEDQRRRIVDDVQVFGSVGCATMTLHHGADTFTDVFLLVLEGDRWQIANKVYHRHA